MAPLSVVQLRWLGAMIIALFILGGVKYYDNPAQQGTLRATVHEVCRAPEAVDKSQSSSIAAQVKKLDTRIKSSLESNVIQVMVLIGTRPEAIKMAPVIKELKARPDRFECIVVSTGQHREMLLQVLGAFHLTDAIDVSFDVMKPDQTLSGLSSAVLDAMAELFKALRPHMLLVQGDTTSAFIASLAAFYHNIPVGHVEAGLRTRNIYSPFPEELNRMSISNVAALNFAATAYAAKNLQVEAREVDNIFITGNPVVDALKSYIEVPPSTTVAALQKKVASACSGPCRLILLTAHRRENHGDPLINIMHAVVDILSAYPDTLVLYPVHLNPNVLEGVRKSVPAEVYGSLVGTATAALPAPYDRLMLVKPADYQDLVHYEHLSYFIMTDSGGIQEEGASMGKPLLVLRDTTERPEGVLAGVAKLIGTDREAIVKAAAELLSSREAYDAMSGVKNIYGDGTASRQIADVMTWFFEAKAQPALAPPAGRYSDLLAAEEAAKAAKEVEEKAKGSGSGKDVVPASARTDYDLVIILTVWKRATLDVYFQMIRDSSILTKGLRVNIVVFKNGDHVDVTAVLAEWSKPGAWPEKSIVTVTYVHSPIPSGYYGRFLAPMLAKVRDGGYFVIADDDLYFGSRYIENMLRVVDEGSLAVRNGRFVVPKGNGVWEEGMGASSNGWNRGTQCTFEEDIPYDFGGHMWAGKVDWLRMVWSHPPITLVTAEDFWISAVLKMHYGIGTKRPRCPAGDMEQCACSMQEAASRGESQVGEKHGGDVGTDRQVYINMVKHGYNYESLPSTAWNFEARTYHFWGVDRPAFSTAGHRFQNCLFFT